MWRFSAGPAPYLCVCKMKDGDFGVGISLENVIVGRRMTLESVGGAFECSQSGAKKGKKEGKTHEESSAKPHRK